MPDYKQLVEVYTFERDTNCLKNAPSKIRSMKEDAAIIISDNNYMTDEFEVSTSFKMRTINKNKIKLVYTVRIFRLSGRSKSNANQMQYE